MTANVFALLPGPRSRGRTAVQDNRLLCRFFPDRRGDLHYIYAVGFIGGVLKVGRTGRPRKRLQQHWQAAKGDVQWMHLFESMSHTAACLVEMRAAAALEDIAERVNDSEWYRFSADKREAVVRIRAVVAATKLDCAECDALTGTAHHWCAAQLRYAAKEENFARRTAHAALNLRAAQ